MHCQTLVYLGAPQEARRALLHQFKISFSPKPRLAPTVPAGQSRRCRPWAASPTGKWLPQHLKRGPRI